MNYDDFLATKFQIQQPSGFEVELVSEKLFDFQKEIVRWALRRGKAAVFASTGLGKTRIELEWAHHVAEKCNSPVLILAPLAVAKQTKAEADAIGINATLCRDENDVLPGINVTNYDRLHRFESVKFGGVVLDESSCIKHFASKLFDQLKERFASTSYRLAATATPAPNDYTELGTHAEFLGVCTRAEMLAEFFVHDMDKTQDWRLKGHARGVFWRWVSGWGVLVRSPEDIGFDGAAYVLPDLTVENITTKQDIDTLYDDGYLVPPEALTLSERRAVRRGSIDGRVAEAAKLTERPGQWLVWCDLNAENDALEAAIPGAVSVQGSDTIEDKEDRLSAFARGEIRVLISKPSIAGWGLNFQRCNQMVFVGVTDSWESYFQAVRRCWRFGQKNPVKVYVVTSEREGAVVKNIERKDKDAGEMGEALAKEARIQIKNSGKTVRQRNDTTHKRKADIPSFLSEGV